MLKIKVLQKSQLLFLLLTLDTFFLVGKVQGLVFCVSFCGIAILNGPIAPFNLNSL